MTLDRRRFFTFMAGGAVSARLVSNTSAQGDARQARGGEPQSPPGPTPAPRTMRRLVATFYGVPYVDNWDDLKAQVTFVGVPFDMGTTSRPGARFGPEALRRIVPGGYTAETKGFYDYEAEEWLLQGVTMADVGDVAILPTDFAPNLERITDAVKRILSKNSLPVVFGGDHSVTFPVVRAYEQVKKPMHIIHFDSHMDFREGRLVRFAHGNPMRRSSELPWVSGITTFGARGLEPENVELVQAKEKGVQVIPALKALRMGIKEAVATITKAERYYVTFDLDVLDPSLAPATGTPEPGGFSYYQAKEALTEVAKKGKVVGIDFVELAPAYDFADTTSRIAARLVMDFLGAVFKHRGA